MFANQCLNGRTEISQISLKYLNLSSKDKQNSYGFGTNMLSIHVKCLIFR